jgi:hypothetical protein
MGSYAFASCNYSCFCIELGKEDHLAKLNCNTLFTHAGNACIFRASLAKPRLFSITKVKTHRNALGFLLEIFLFKIEIACFLKFETECHNEP